MAKSLLGVNIDHIATLRNARGTAWPDPVYAAFIAEQAGADSITVHLRADRRHINDRDIHLLHKTIQTRMNLEMAATEEMVAIACSLPPRSCCLVPENRREVTTESGLDVLSQRNILSRIVTRLKNRGIQVSLFINANKLQIEAAAEIGASHIEIHTGIYANAINERLRSKELININENAQYAKGLGLTVNAGHGLDYYNVKPIAELGVIHEFNIGHAIISRAVISGLSKAVKDMKQLILEARNCQ